MSVSLVFFTFFIEDFLHPYSQGLLRKKIAIFFPCNVFNFGIIGTLEGLGSDPYSSSFWKSLRSVGANYSLNIW